jgi:GNAT superfamily N-acetyltransferase
MFERIDGQVRLVLEDFEAELLEQLLGQMVDLLDVPDVEKDPDPLAALVGMDGPTEKPTDPALARLFPDGYIDDSEASSEFRMFTEPELRNKKTMAARIAQATLEHWKEKYDLTDEQAQSWLLALNDMRLTLGTRLGVGEVMDDEFDPDEPGFHLYDWLTYIQGTLVEALMP